MVALTNRSDAKREYIPFDVALCCRDLVVTIMQPDGTPKMKLGPQYKAKLLGDRSPVRSWQTKTGEFDFDHLGYWSISTPGVYELRASLKTDEGLVVAPAFKLRVIEPAAD